MRKFIWLSFVFILGCSNSDFRISKLKWKYSAKDINAFYERSFTLDTIEWPPYLIRWHSDIYYFIKGDTCPDNIGIVYQVTNEYNALDLPIRFIETKEERKANLLISFGTNFLPVSPYKPGNTKMVNIYNSLKKGVVEIRTGENYYNESKQFILLHEMGHVLGLPNHVYTTTQSAFHANSNFDRLSDDDKTCLKMLYDPLWPRMYRLSDFEKDFSGELYHINISKREFNLDQKKAMDSILHYCLLYDTVFTHPGIIKFTHPIKISITGNVANDWNEIIQSTLSEINSVTNLNMEYSPANKKSDLGSINIHCIQNPQMIGDSITTIAFSKSNAVGGHFVVLRSINYEFEYKEETEKNKEIISYLIFNSICPLPSQTFKSEIKIENNEVVFNQFLKDMIGLLYSEDFPYNISKEALLKIK